MKVRYYRILPRDTMSMGRWLLPNLLRSMHQQSERGYDAELTLYQTRNLILNFYSS